MAHQSEHSGVVEQVGHGRVFVRITAQDACGTCRAREACGMGESGDKIIEVCTPHAAAFVVGEQVMVGIGQRMGIMAVILAYVVPFFFLLGTLVATTVLGIEEGVAALSALGAVAVYYGLLWLARHKIENTIHFTINK